jgi:hypothetical protein
MKRHTNPLLQRKRVDFDSAQSAPPKSQRQETRSGAEQHLEVKDGYDWLHQMAGRQVKVQAVAA